MTLFSKQQFVTKKVLTFRVSASKYQFLKLKIEDENMTVSEGPVPDLKQVTFVPSKPVIVDAFQVCLSVTFANGAFKHKNISVMYTFLDRILTQIEVKKSSILTFDSTDEIDEFFFQKSVFIPEPESNSLNVSVENMLYDGAFETDGKCPYGGLAVYEFKRNQVAVQEFLPLCWNTRNKPGQPFSEFYPFHNIITEEKSQAVLVFYIYPQFAKITLKLEISETACIGHVIELNNASKMDIYVMVKKGPEKPPDVQHYHSIEHMCDTMHYRRFKYHCGYRYVQKKPNAALPMNDSLACHASFCCTFEYCLASQPRLSRWCVALFHLVIFRDPPVLCEIL